MYLECILVCVNYSDFLNHTLPYNKHNFDMVHVVTTHDDIDTQNIVKKYNANLIITNRLYENGAKFNKAKAINDGIKRLKKEWVLITDADMIMPNILRKKLENIDLDKELIYGTTRYMCPSYNEWVRYKNTNDTSKWQHQNRRLQIGVGFFQLVHGQCTRLAGTDVWYDEKFTTAARSDRCFLRSFANRGILKDIVPIHLESEPSEMGANWNGRITKKFGG